MDEELDPRAAVPWSQSSTHHRAQSSCLTPDLSLSPLFQLSIGQLQKKGRIRGQLHQLSRLWATMLISAQKRVSRSHIGNLCRPGLQLGETELVTDTSGMENKPGDFLEAGMYMKHPSYYKAVRAFRGNAVGNRWDVMGCGVTGTLRWILALPLTLPLPETYLSWFLWASAPPPAFLDAVHAYECVNFNTGCGVHFYNAVSKQPTNHVLPYFQGYISKLIQGNRAWAWMPAVRGGDNYAALASTPSSAFPSHQPAALPVLV